VRVAPSPPAHETAQDRLAEKALFERVGLATAAFESVDSLEGLLAALDRIGTPAVLKTRRLGYDGKGQIVVSDPVLAEDAWRSLGEAPSILEGVVAFDRELSIVAVRGDDGDTRVYPPAHNEHRGGILRVTRAPAAGVTTKTWGEAERLVRSVMDDLGYVGVIAIELFQMGERLLGNELAPRVHNSAHWTIEGAETSQFENHLRAVTGLPLGSTEPRGHSAMVNLIGSTPDPSSVAAIPGAHLHLYGKEPRPGRKLGHVTVRADDAETVERTLLQVEALVDDAHHE
jgi:5-(carboxyamino)imidazole ribonucleotide synthase